MHNIGITEHHIQLQIVRNIKFTREHHLFKFGVAKLTATFHTRSHTGKLTGNCNAARLIQHYAGGGNGLECVAELRKKIVRRHFGFQIGF